MDCESGGRERVGRRICFVSCLLQYIYSKEMLAAASEDVSDEGNLRSIQMMLLFPFLAASCITD